MQVQTTQTIKYFIYPRKSSESEDQQVASIDSQIKELKTIAQRDNLQIVDILPEAQSAKAPGRPVFNEMLERIAKNEGAGILCWKLDRLARNPVDGGNISWMLQQGIIHHIRTHDRNYYPTDNVLMMSVELGMANQFIRDLSENTKRGLKAKVEKGWYPGLAKPGYLNEFDRRKGERTTPKDPRRFRLIQRAFHLVHSGTYTPPQVHKKLNDEWGYRTPKRRKLGGTPMAHSTFYRILTDPFYYGSFEYPIGSGNWYRGKHKPMITEATFWQIQDILGKKGRPRPQKRTFAFTGLLSCGECTAAITAESKEQTICSVCKRKFASRNRQSCPACNTPIQDMQNPTRLYYEYYHCTKRKHPACSQKAVEVKELESQILQILDTISIPKTLRDWYIQRLEEYFDYEAKDEIPILESLQKAQADCQKRLDNLLKLKISPQNADGELLSDDEFAAQKSTITREMCRLQQKMADISEHASRWKDACIKTFDFACYAKTHFKKGSLETKRTILSALGSNLTLEDKNLRISLHNHFLLIKKMRKGLEAQNAMFEPKNLSQDKRKNRAIDPAFPTWLRGWDDVRTIFAKVSEKAIFIPTLPGLIVK